jgi:CheY-like chemotaxis protein/two-component sensor histidine kinase
MLAYSGKATFEVAPLDLSGEVREISELLSSSIPKKVELVFDLGAELPAIEADRAQIQQLAMNLVINAAEASGESVGRVEISTGHARLSAGELGWRFPSEGPPAGDYVTLQVRDNGCGMDDATMDRMFDPFFTTKFTGRGLGLAAVLGIVRAHRAALKVESRPGQGTRFRVLFPVSQKRVQPAVEQRPARDEGHACVLVIDDEPLVLEMAAAALEHQGFVPMLAASGEEGVARFREHGDEIDVVLLDMTLPRMGGEEVLRELRALRADVRVILTSGYSELEASRHVPLSALAGFLQKPYSPRTLAAKVRAALDRP